MFDIKMAGFLLRLFFLEATIHYSLASIGIVEGHFYHKLPRHLAAKLAERRLWQYLSISVDQLVRPRSPSLLWHSFAYCSQLSYFTLPEKMICCTASCVDTSASLLPPFLFVGFMSAAARGVTWAFDLYTKRNKNQWPGAPVKKS